MLGAEMEEHLKHSEDANRKNGKVSKTIKTEEGQFELTTGRDRNGSFESQIIKKRETVLPDILQECIILIESVTWQDDFRN